VRHLPTEPLAVSALPPVTSRDECEAARARLLVKEKAHTGAGQRHRLQFLVSAVLTAAIAAVRQETPSLR
jgi:hypothetical protein